MKYLLVMIKSVSVFLLLCSLSSCVTTATKDHADVSDIEINEEYGVDDAVNEAFAKAVQHIKDEQYNEAITLLIEVTEKSNKHSAPYVNLGIAYLKLGKIQESEESLLKALKINPDHPVTNNELGIVYRKSGRFKEAKSVYLHVLEKFPLFLPARMNVAILCDLFMNDFHCAIQHYSEYLKLKANDKNVQIWLTDVKRRAGVK